MGKKTTYVITELIEAIHEELRALLARRNYSQRQLEGMSGVSQGVISKSIFRNESVLNLSQLEAICEALGISPSAVLESAEKAVLETQRNQANEQRPGGHYNQAGEWVPETRAGYSLAAYDSDEEKGVDYIED